VSKLTRPIIGRNASAEQQGADGEPKGGRQNGRSSGCSGWKLKERPDAERGGGRVVATGSGEVRDVCRANVGELSSSGLWLCSNLLGSERTQQGVLG